MVGKLRIPYKERGFNTSNRQAVLSDLKAFYDGYHFTPGAEPLCNWFDLCRAP